MIVNLSDLRKALKKKIFAGVILYEGASAIDGAPIVAIANRIMTKTKNEKTGAMVQTFIIRADVNPIAAVKDGRDESVCGNCPQRPILGGKCYVDIAKAPYSVFGAYQRGRYARPGVDYDPALLPALFEDSAFRLGTYGDPAAIPFQVWRAATLKARKITGYSHQWRDMRFQAFKLLCMASVETESDQLLASACGWRTFRAKQSSEIKTSSEIGCPAAKENGQRSSCAKCGLCSGNSSNSPRNIVINLHGFRVGRKKAA